jgi:dipeptidase E
MSQRIVLTSNTANVWGSLQSIAGTTPQKMVVITTAMEVEDDADTWYPADQQAFAAQPNLEVSEYTITSKNEAELRQELAKADIIYITGGNVFYLMQQIQKSGFHKIVREHVQSGKILIGHSAGAIALGPDIAPAYRSDKADKVEKLDNTKGMGLVDFVTLPHWGSEQLRDVYFNERLKQAYNPAYKIIPISDSQYIDIVDDCYKIVAVTP